MVLSVLSGYRLGSKNNNVQDNVQVYSSNHQYLEKGKFIGRNAFLIYMSENNHLVGDTIDIKIDRLLELEDSLQRVEDLR